MKLRVHIAIAAVGALALGGGARAQGGPDYKVVGQVSMPDGGWDYSTFDPATHTIYTARGGTIQSLDADTLTVNPKIATAMGSHSPVPLPGDRLLITNGGNNTVTIVSAKDGSELANIPTGRGPDGAIYDPSSRLAFVAEHAGGEVVFIDPKAMKETGRVTVGGTLEFLAADDHGHVFVNVEDKGQIAKIDIKTKQLATYPIDGCMGPSGLAYAQAARVLIAACRNGVAAVVDPESGKTLQTLPIGEGPDAVMYDAKRKVAFVPCGQSGVLTVISAASRDKLAVAQTVTTQTGARSGAVDPRTGRVYLPAELFAAPTGTQRRGAPVPNTAVILVVAP